MFQKILSVALFVLFAGIFSTPLHAEETTQRKNSAFSFDIGKNRTVILAEQGNPIWQYNADFLLNPKVPEKDPRCMAGCFVHPLYGISGEILTDDAPRDHYHHHGVFWTWPHVHVHRPDGTVDKFDLWMSNTRLKQLFVRFLDFKVEDDKATFRVENGWFIGSEINQFEWDTRGNPISEKIVDEIVSITTHPVVRYDGMRSIESPEIRTRAIDINLQWIIGSQPISLRGAGGKSYGGLTVRFRPSPNKPGAESVITVPDGVAKDDLPDTPLIWADYTSQFEMNADGKPTGKRSGAAIFVPKTHPDFPPTWLTRYYGPLCIGWPGVHERKFQPGEKIEFSYRIWVHDKAVDVEQLEKAYEIYDRYADEFLPPAETEQPK